MGSACTKHSRSHSPETIYTVPNPTAGWFRKSTVKTSVHSSVSSVAAGTEESESSLTDIDSQTEVFRALQKSPEKTSSYKSKGRKSSRKKSSLFGLFKAKGKREEELMEGNSEDEDQKSTTELSVDDEQLGEASDSTLVDKQDPEEDRESKTPQPDQSNEYSDCITKANVSDLLGMEESVRQESQEGTENREEESLMEESVRQESQEGTENREEESLMEQTFQGFTETREEEPPIEQACQEGKETREEESLVEQTFQAPGIQGHAFDEDSVEEDESNLTGSEVSSLTVSEPKVEKNHADEMFSSFNKKEKDNGWRTHMLNVQVVYEGLRLSSPQKDLLGEEVSMLVNVLLSKTDDVPKKFVGQSRHFQRRIVKMDDERSDDVVNPEKGRMKRESITGEHVRRFQQTKYTKRQNPPTPRAMRIQKKINKMYLLKSDSDFDSDDSLELGSSDPLDMLQRDRRSRRRARSNYGGVIDELNDKLYEIKTRSSESSSSVNTFYTVQEDITDAIKPHSLVNSPYLRVVVGEVQRDTVTQENDQFLTASDYSKGRHGRDRSVKKLRDGLREHRRRTPTGSSPYVSTPVKRRDLNHSVCKDEQLLQARLKCFQQNIPDLPRNPSPFTKELRDKVLKMYSSSSATSFYTLDKSHLEQISSISSSSPESIREVRKSTAAAVRGVQKHPPKMVDRRSLSSQSVEVSSLMKPNSVNLNSPTSPSQHKSSPSQVGRKNKFERSHFRANTPKMREQVQHEKTGRSRQSPAKIISRQHTRSTRSPEVPPLIEQDMKMRRRRRQPRKSPTVLNPGFTTSGSQCSKTTRVVTSPRMITNVVQQKQDMIAPKPMYLNKDRMVDNVNPQQKHLQRSRSSERQSPALASTAKVKISPSVALSDVAKDKMRKHRNKQKSDSETHSVLKEVRKVSTKVPENVVPLIRTPTRKSQAFRSTGNHANHVSTPKVPDLSTSTDQRHVSSKPELQSPSRRKPVGDHATSLHESSSSLNSTSITVPVDNDFKKKSVRSPRKKTPQTEKGRSPTRMNQNPFSVKRSPENPHQRDATLATPPQTAKRRTRVKFKDIPPEEADYERSSEQHQTPKEASPTPLHSAPDQFVANSRSNQQSVQSMSNPPAVGQMFSSPAQALAFSQFPGVQSPNYIHQGPMRQPPVYPANMYQFANVGQGQHPWMPMYGGIQQQQQYASPLMHPSRMRAQGMYFPNVPVPPNMYGNQQFGYPQLATSNLQMGVYPHMQQQTDSTKVTTLNQDQRQEAVSVATSHSLNTTQTTTAPTTSLSWAVLSESATQEKAKSDEKPWSDSEEKKRLVKSKQLASSENSLNTTPQKPRKWRQCEKERDEGDAWWMPNDWAKERGIGNYGNEWEFDGDEKKEKELQIAKDANIEQIRMSRFIPW